MALHNLGSEKPEVIMIDELRKEETICDAEKSRQIHLIDDIRVLGLGNEDAEFYNSVTSEQRKIITRKVQFIRSLISVKTLTSCTGRHSSCTDACGTISHLSLGPCQYRCV